MRHFKDGNKNRSTLEYAWHRYLWTLFLCMFFHHNWHQETLTCFGKKCSLFDHVLMPSFMAKNNNDVIPQYGHSLTTE